MSSKKYKTGIALGGGGARGFTHLGVLKALSEKGIDPEVISGVSAGAMVGLFLAAGKSPDEIMQLMKDNEVMDYAEVVVPVNGLLSLNSLQMIIEEHIKAKTFEELSTPFYVTVSDLLEGKVIYQHSGELIPYVQASASIPVLFSPVEIAGKLLVDGGLFDNLPVKPLQDCCEKIIAVSISPIQKVEDADSLIKVAARTFQLSVNSQLEEVEENCDLFIEPDGLSNYDILDTAHADELFKLGYEHTRKLDLSAFSKDT